MKKQISLTIAVCLCLGLLAGCGNSGGANTNQPSQSGESQTTQTADAAALVRNIPTVQYFADEAVAEEDIQLILEAGVQAPSAINQQPWHFTAVTDTAVLEQIAGDMGGGMGGFPGGGTPPTGGEMPELPDGMEMPSFDGSTPPDGAKMPELPEGSEMPSFDGGTLPDGSEIPERPEGTKMPNGGSGMPPAGGGGASTAANKAGIADAPLAIIVSAKEGSEFDAGLACQNMSVEAQLLGYGTKIISSPTMALNGSKQAEYRELLGIPEEQSAVAILLVGYEDTSAAIENGADAITSATARNPMDTVVTYVKAD